MRWTETYSMFMSLKMRRVPYLAEEKLKGP